MFGSLDPAKILVVLVIALIVLGPERLPKAARQMGAYWHEFTRIRQEVTDEVRAALPSPDDLPPVPRIPSVRGTLTRYMTEAASPDGGEAKAAADRAPNGETAAGGGALMAAGEGSTPFGEFGPSADDPSMN